MTVDAARTGHGPDAFLRRLAGDLSKEAIENVTDSTLVACAELLRRFSESTKVTVRETQQWTRSLQLGTSVKYQFLDKVQFEFGLTRAKTRSRTVEDSYERTVDDNLLRELIQEFLSDCRGAGQHTVLFLDNLNQVGYGEIEEDVKRVTNLGKLYSHEIAVEGMGAEELLMVARARMLRASEKSRKELQEAGFLELARQLTRWTNNAWGFLNWLMFLDYQAINFSPDDEKSLRQALMRFAEQRYAGLRREEIEQIGKVFRGEEPTRFLTAGELDTHGITRELLERAVRYGALIPDWLLSPDRYMLAPGLHFLAPRS